MIRYQKQYSRIAGAQALDNIASEENSRSRPITRQNMGAFTHQYQLGVWHRDEIILYTGSIVSPCFGNVL